MSTPQEILELLKSKFPEYPLSLVPMVKRGDEESEECYLRVVPEHLLDVMTFLRNDRRTKFSQLSDVTCVDYLDFPGAKDRYGVTYTLASIQHATRFWVKCFVNDPTPTVPSVYSVWKGADWQEREIFDLFGIKFEGHPDLRRIMTWDGFKAHPLRKDYPLHGRGEREDFEVVERDSA